MRATVSALATFMSPGGGAVATPAAPAGPVGPAVPLEPVGPAAPAAPGAPSACGRRLSGAGALTLGRPDRRPPTPPPEPSRCRQGPTGGRRAVWSNRPRPAPDGRHGPRNGRLPASPPPAP